MTSPADIRGTVEAVWRIESARIVATLARMTGDLSLAEDLAQEALVDALAQWPESGVPRNAGAWLTAVAKRKAIDGWRRRERRDERYRAMARDLVEAREQDWEPIEDDLLRLVFTACHPVLSADARVTLTLRIVGGLSTEEIARLLLAPVPTVAQRIGRAKKTLSAAAVPFAAPDREEWGVRLGSVLAVVYLIFTEGYAATSGDRWIRPELAGLLPAEPEVHGLVALMEFQASRFGARTAPDGSPILLADQDRSRWDRTQIGRGRAALARADRVGRGRGSYGLQAGIAECHATPSTFAETEWDRIVLLYEALGALAPNPVVELNRAVAVSMATGPEAALLVADGLVAQGALRGSHLLPSVRGELLRQLGRTQEARAELLRAAGLTTNQRESAELRAKADTL